MQAFATPGANTTNKFAVLVKKAVRHSLQLLHQFYYGWMRKNLSRK